MNHRETPKSIVIFSFLTWSFLSFFSSNGLAAKINYISEGNSKGAVIFIHGIYGDAHSTFRKNDGKSWPELMVGDTRKMRTDLALSDYAIATVEYEAGKDSSFSVEELANRVLTDVIDAGVYRKYDQVIFIAHSMGGLILKRALIGASFRKSFASVLKKTKAVLLISVPSKGTPAADLLTWLPDIFTGRPIIDLEEIDENAFLQMIDSLWRDFFRIQIRPKIFCAYEKKPIGGKVIVPEMYTETLCDEQPRPENANHINIVKPSSIDESIYSWARSRIGDVASLDNASLDNSLDRLRAEREKLTPLLAEFFGIYNIVSTSLASSIGQKHNRAAQESHILKFRDSFSLLISRVEEFETDFKLSAERIKEISVKPKYSDGKALLLEGIKRLNDGLDMWVEVGRRMIGSVAEGQTVGPQKKRLEKYLTEALTLTNSGRNKIRESDRYFLLHRETWPRLDKSK